MADGSIGQMMEPAELPEFRPIKKERPNWATSGAIGRPPRSLSSIYLKPEDMEQMNFRLLQNRYEIQTQEVRYREYYLDDAEFVVVGFGTAGRVALSAVRAARSEGVRVGLIRPITLNPFPSNELIELARNAQAFLVVEMNSGQMLQDVSMAMKGICPIEFYGRMGGVVPFPEEILHEIRRIAREPEALSTIDDPRQKWMRRFKMGRIAQG
jgi:2-oxoglutarate ferredoxin oxidoreductase subunit alpha